MQIQSEVDYESALKRIDELWGADPLTLEGQELGVLFLAVESYEDEHYPMDEPKSYAAIEFHLERLGLSVDELPVSLDEKRMLKVCISNRVLVPEALTMKMSHLLDVPRDVLGIADATSAPLYSARIEDSSQRNKNLPLHDVKVPSKSKTM